MPDRLSQKIEADVNGDGVLIDLSDWLESTSAITHEWGRTDWSSDSPNPGSLEFTLSNSDGRFTPGSSTEYAIGCRDGVLVQWTCGTRVRRFRMGTPQVAFPQETGSYSTVTVPCLDVLGAAAARQMRPMVDEEVLLASPVAYYVLDEMSASALDSSGYGQPAISPVGAVDADFGWGLGQGPATDGRGCLQMFGDVSAAPDSDATLVSTTTLQLEDYTWTDDTSGEPVWGLSCWFTIRDVYGGTSADSSDANGPYVHVCGVLFGSDLTERCGVYWRPSDRHLIVVTAGRAYALDDPVAVSLLATHHVAVSWATVPGTSGRQVKFRVWLDGKDRGTVTVPLDSTSAAALGVPSGLALCTDTAPAVCQDQDADSGFDATLTTYKLSGSLACVSLHGPEGVSWDSDNSRPVMARQDQIYKVGQLGAPETALARYKRLGGYLGLSGVSWSSQGTGRSEKVGPQDSADRALLDVMCEALRGEDADLDEISDGSSDTVRAWLYSTHRAETSSLRVNTESDSAGVPGLSFDSSGVATTVTVTSAAGSVSWRDPDDPARYRGSNARVTAAYVDADMLAQVGQYRSWRGRVDRLAVQSVVVDQTTAEADLSADLLALRPGQRVTTAGLPAAKLGFGETDAYVVGASESHDVARSLWTLYLMPIDALEARTAPEDD